MNGLRVRWETLAFWAMLSAFLVLAEVVRQRPEPNTFGDYDPASLGAHHVGVYRYRPVDYLYPAGMRVPMPHARAYDGDRQFLAGHLSLAAAAYEEALAQQPADTYSRLLAACAWTELGQQQRAWDHAAELVERVSALRTAHLLRHYLDQRRRHPSAGRAASYLAALVQVAADPRLVAPVNSDLLQDMVEDRVLGARPPHAPTPPSDSRLAAAWRLLQPGGAREERWRILEEHGDIPLSLLALALLGPPASEGEVYRLRDVLTRLGAQEPDNAYWDYLQAAADLTRYRMREDSEEPPASWELPDEPAAVRALQESLGRPAFDTHLEETYGLAVECVRRTRVQFPEQHVPAPRSFLFLGDVTFPSRLAAEALASDPQRDGVRAETLLRATARLLTWQEQLCQDPFAGEDVSAWYREQFLAHPLVAEQAGAFRPLMHRWRPLPAVPHRLRLLQRYLQRPLPIPSLARELTERYAGRLDLLARDLQVAWERR